MFLPALVASTRLAQWVGVALAPLSSGSTRSPRADVPLDARSTHVKIARVLIHSGDVLVAALLGALFATEEVEPLFPADGETTRDALLRLRPSAILIDGESDDAADERALGAAMMIGATIVLYGPARARSRMEEIGTRYGARILQLPVVAGHLGPLLAPAG